MIQGKLEQYKQERTQTANGWVKIQMQNDLLRQGHLPLSSPVQ